jgi:hypothetical protein
MLWWIHNSRYESRSHLGVLLVESPDVDRIIHIQAAWTLLILLLSLPAGGVEEEMVGATSS